MLSIPLTVRFPSRKSGVIGIWFVLIKPLDKHKRTSTNAMGGSCSASSAIAWVKCCPSPTWVCPVHMRLGKLGPFCLVCVCEITLWDGLTRIGADLTRGFPPLEDICWDLKSMQKIRLWTCALCVFWPLWRQNKWYLGALEAFKKLLQGTSTLKSLRPVCGALSCAAR